MDFVVGRSRVTLRNLTSTTVILITVATELSINRIVTVIWKQCYE